MLIAQDAAKKVSQVEKFIEKKTPITKKRKPAHRSMRASRAEFYCGRVAYAGWVSL